MYLEDMRMDMEEDDLEEKGREPHGWVSGSLFWWQLFLSR